MASHFTMVQYLMNSQLSMHPTQVLEKTAYTTFTLHCLTGSTRVNSVVVVLTDPRLHCILATVSTQLIESFKLT